MKYQQYKKTALKHLLTCEYMIANLSHETPNKLDVLRNVYYLCGYTFEGLINFWIFKLLRSEGLTCDDQTYSITNPVVLPNGKKLCWTENKLIDGTTVKSDYWINQHKFMKNIEVFDCISVGNLFAQVPIIGDQSLVSQRTLDLFRNWDVEIRYKNHPFTKLYAERGNELVFENDVKEFVLTARSVWNELDSITI